MHFYSEFVISETKVWKLNTSQKVIILMAAILEKCLKVHFVCNFFLATSTIWNLGALSFPMIYLSLRPSFGTDKPLYVTD